MKRIFVLLLTILIIFSGCSAFEKVAVPTIPNLNFNGNINVSFNKFELQCTIENRVETGCKITVVKPALLAGLEIHAKDGACNFKIGEISYDVDQTVLKNTEFVSALSEAFAKALITTEYERTDDGNWRYTGKTSVGNFILIQDGKSGYPVSLDIPNKNLYVTFSEMRSNDGG